jgi:hypothetical protein
MRVSTARIGSCAISSIAASGMGWYSMAVCSKSGPRMALALSLNLSIDRKRSDWLTVGFGIETKVPSGWALGWQGHSAPCEACYPGSGSASDLARADKQAHATSFDEGPPATLCSAVNACPCCRTLSCVTKRRHDARIAGQVDEAVQNANAKVWLAQVIRLHLLCYLYNKLRT